MSMANTPAGWYPQDDGRQRYWDGETWTEHFAPGAQQGNAMAGGATLAAGGSGAVGTQSAARPWFKKKRFIIPAGLAGLAILGSSLDGGGDAPNAPTAVKSAASTGASTTPSTAAPATSPPAGTAPAVPVTKAPVATPAPKPKPAAPTLTTAQENAKESAEDYLDYSGFSQKGLIKQLEFEEYRTKDIEAALATMKVDWNAEAAESAAAYVDYSSFSHSGLVKQLKFEGYTTKQAEHGADSVGL